MSFDNLTACPRCANPLAQKRRPILTAPAGRPEATFLSAVEAEQEQVEAGFFTGGNVLADDLDSGCFSLPAELHTAVRPPLVYGGVGRRAVAALIDAPFLFILMILAMIVAFLAAIGGGTVAGQVTRDVTLLALGAALAAAFMVSLAYHVLCWGQGGQTPGMMLLGLQVVGQDGEEIGYMRAFLRWVVYVLTLPILVLSVILMLLQPRRRGVHDILAGTCVIRSGSEAGQ